MGNRIVISLALASCLYAQPLRSLKPVSVPEVPGLDTYVRDRVVLIALGKPFFWDMQVDSDGRRQASLAGRASFDQPELCGPGAGSPETRTGLLIAAQSRQFPRSSTENWLGSKPAEAADGARANAMNEVCTAPLP
jgi:hypothetical protein